MSWRPKDKSNTSPEPPPKRFTPNDIALTSPFAPELKTEEQWLRDMGYVGGFNGFMDACGYKPGDEHEEWYGRRLLNELREEQQKKWEELHPGYKERVAAEGQGKGETAGQGGEQK